MNLTLKNKKILNGKFNGLKNGFELLFISFKNLYQAFQGQEFFNMIDCF